MNADPTPVKPVLVSELLNAPSRWTKGAYFCTEDGRTTDFPYPEGSFCLVGAVIYKHRILLGRYPFALSAYVEPFSEDDIYADAKRDILKLARLIQPDYDINTAEQSPVDIITAWNDSYWRTWEEVIDLVNHANV